MQPNGLPVSIDSMSGPASSTTLLLLMTLTAGLSLLYTGCQTPLFVYALMFLWQPEKSWLLQLQQLSIGGCHQQQDLYIIQNGQSGMTSGIKHVVKKLPKIPKYFLKNEKKKTPALSCMLLCCFDSTSYCWSLRKVGHNPRRATEFSRNCRANKQCICKSPSLGTEQEITVVYMIPRGSLMVVIYIWL